MTSTGTYALVDRAVGTLRRALEQARAEGEPWAARDLERALALTSQAASHLRHAKAGDTIPRGGETCQP